MRWRAAPRRPAREARPGRPRPAWAAGPGRPPRRIRRAHRRCRCPGSGCTGPPGPGQRGSPAQVSATETAGKVPWEQGLPAGGQLPGTYRYAGSFPAVRGSNVHGGHGPVNGARWQRCAAGTGTAHGKGDTSRDQHSCGHRREVAELRHAGGGGAPAGARRRRRAAVAAARAAWLTGQELAARQPVYGRNTGVGANHVVELGERDRSEPGYGCCAATPRAPGRCWRPRWPGPCSWCAAGRGR